MVSRQPDLGVGSRAGPGVRAIAASGPLESGSRPVGFSLPPPRTTLLLFMDKAGHSSPLHLSSHVPSSEAA